MSYLTGVGLTPYGRHEGSSTLDLMSRAATEALSDADLTRFDVDAVLTGYSTTLPHLMLASLFSEHFGIDPSYAHGLQAGGATSGALLILADLLVRSGTARHVLVVAGENRLTGQSRDASVQVLAQVGHPRYEVPLGPTIPAYYGLLAARYCHQFNLTPADLAELAVLMRQHASLHPDAQFRNAIVVADVLASKPIAPPLRLLDCCGMADGGAAIVISREPRHGTSVRIIGAGQAHLHQHISALDDVAVSGAKLSADRAAAARGITITDVRYAAIYDSFTITLAVLLEEIGLAPRGGSAALARDGFYGIHGRLPLNTHGGLLSYGHCGVAGALAHVVEAQRQMTGRAGARQVKDASLVLVHGDGGVLSSHTSFFLEQVP